MDVVNEALIFEKEPYADQMDVVNEADNVVSDKEKKKRDADEKKRLNDARHRRFRRGLEPTATQRTSAKANRCPPALALKIKAMNSAEVAEMFQIFGECNED